MSIISLSFVTWFLLSYSTEIFVSPFVSGRNYTAGTLSPCVPALSVEKFMSGHVHGSQSSHHVWTRLCESGPVFWKEGGFSNPGANFPLAIHHVNQETKEQNSCARCRNSPAVKCFMNTSSYSPTGSQVLLEPPVPFPVPNNQWERTHTGGRPGEEEQARLCSLRLISVWAKQNLSCWFYLSF